MSLTEPTRGPRTAGRTPLRRAPGEAPAEPAWSAEAAWPPERAEPTVPADTQAPAMPARPTGPAATSVAARTGGSRRTPGPRRIEGLLLGLAAGDAAGWPAARHRAARMPEWTRRLTRELDTFAEQNATTTLPVPIALNQPPEPLRLGPSDDAEWAAFTAYALLRAGDDKAVDGRGRARRLRTAIDRAWHAAARDATVTAVEPTDGTEDFVPPLRARISVRAGLGNLATGLRPPATGHDNPHYFDDAACVRACVLAVAHPGDPRAAADLAEFDARYSQDGDGVHGARAMAAALSLALAGAGVGACVEAALAELPAATEIGRNARHALRLARRAGGGRTAPGAGAGIRAGVAGAAHAGTGTRSTVGTAFALVPLLEHQIVDHVYSYGVAAAETVPVALALAVAAGGRIAEAVPAAACLSRVADSAPALAGALTGALGGGTAIPAAWRHACRRLAGCALPRLAGTDLVELAALLAEKATPRGATGG